MKTAGAAICAGSLLLAGTILTQAQERDIMKMSVAQSDFTENCGGCHGFDGNSAPADIPVLKDRVGYFMCSKEGREYLIRLPNVAHSRITDPQELADLMNFVVFAIGALLIFFVIVFPQGIAGWLARLRTTWLEIAK